MEIDSLPESRRLVLSAIKGAGAATIAELAKGLKMTGEAVRLQLTTLQREGLVERSVEKDEEPRRGRPSAQYRLTTAGEHLFPKRYDSLTVELVDTVAAKLGPEALKSVLEALVDERVRAWRPQLAGLSLRERLEKLRALYLPHDPFATVEATDDGALRLIERNCPFLGVAMRRPALCSVSVNTLSRLLERRVVREERFQNGEGRCVFRVLEDEPVAPEAPFAPEP